MIEGYTHIPLSGVECHKCGSMERTVDDKKQISCSKCGVWFGELPVNADGVGKCVSCLKPDLPVRHLKTVFGGYMRVCFDCYERIWGSK